MMGIIFRLKKNKETGLIEIHFPGEVTVDGTIAPGLMQEFMDKGIDIVAYSPYNGSDEE